MRIGLIIPPSGFHVDERVFPTLGILKVAAALEQAKHEVKVLDLSGVQNPYAKVVVWAQHFCPEVFGITATMPQMPAAVRILQSIRAVSGARVILGGPHPTLMQASARKGSRRAQVAMLELLEIFDSVVCGDGERAVFKALEGELLVDADDIKSPMFLSNDDLDDAPLPARHLIDIDSYHFKIEGEPTMSMIAQLGCPFGCAFCGGRSSPFLRKVRTRSTNNVVREMLRLHGMYGINGFMFLDDELNVNKQFMELLDTIWQVQDTMGVKWRLRGLVKSELLTESMAKAMYRAGFRQILIGFESGHDRILTNIQKHATVAQNTRCVEIAKDAGLTVKACMSLGHPGESLETVQATIDWLLKVKPDEFDVTMLTVYPGTPYYDEAVEDRHGSWVYTSPKTGDKLFAKNVDQLHDVNFYKGKPDGYQAFVWTQHLTSIQLEVARDHAEKVVRAELNIPYPQSYAEIHLEHSMGQR